MSVLIDLHRDLLREHLFRQETAARIEVWQQEIADLKRETPGTALERAAIQHEIGERCDHQRNHHTEIRNSTQRSAEIAIAIDQATTERDKLQRSVAQQQAYMAEGGPLALRELAAKAERDAANQAGDKKRMAWIDEELGAIETERANCASSLAGTLARLDEYQTTMPPKRSRST